MKSLKKYTIGTARLHAALAETDPSSTDLILIRRAGLRPAMRLPALVYPPLRKAAVRPVAASRPRDGLAPAWRKRFAMLPL